MATKLFLRTSATSSVFLPGTTVRDMLPSAGVGSTVSGQATAVASGTEIIFSFAGPDLCWVSGRSPIDGFTLTSTDISIWALQSLMTTNCGGRYRVFKWVPGNIVTELGGGPFSDGVEFGTSSAEMTWIGNVTDTFFEEDSRILLRIYITNVGTMGTGTCSLISEGSDGTEGDSFLNLAETVTFKSESDPPARRRTLKSGMQAVKRANFF